MPKEADKIFDTIEGLEELLEERLPDTDKAHKEELLDIFELARQRVRTYIESYGLNPL